MQVFLVLKHGLLPPSICKRSWKQFAMANLPMISMFAGSRCMNSLWVGILTSMMVYGSIFDHSSLLVYCVVGLRSIGTKIVVQIPMAASASTIFTLLLLRNVK